MPRVSVIPPGGPGRRRPDGPVTLPVGTREHDPSKARTLPWYRKHDGWRSELRWGHAAPRFGMRLDTLAFPAYFISMVRPGDQGAAKTLQALDPVIKVVYPALEAAVHESREFFPEDRPIDSALFPNLVRYFVKVALTARGLTAVEEDQPLLKHEILPNNGLYLEFGPRRIRIRKADNGGLPAAASRSLADFYQQDTLFDEEISFQNLLLLWDVIEGIVHLQLVCPKTRDGAVHWSIPVAHPAETHKAPPAEEPQEIDLPIRLPEASSDDD
jgi:hypothetical protein